MKTTNHPSKRFARNTLPETLGRRTLALESMEARMVLTAAMSVDAPECGDEQVEVASYEVDATLPALGDGSEQNELASYEVDATLPAPGGEDEQSLSSYEVIDSAERPAEFYVASNQISTSIEAPGGEDEQEAALLLLAY